MDLLDEQRVFEIRTWISDYIHKYMNIHWTEIMLIKFCSIYRTPELKHHKNVSYIKYARAQEDIATLIIPKYHKHLQFQQRIPMNYQVHINKR